MKQLTLAKAVKGVGIGLHKGEPIEIALEPLEANSGIVFFRSDLNATYKASPENVINTQMATVLGDERGFISTIEHLMSAINAYGIDNVRVVLNANEAPVMDG
ncbi:UDP-3-O-acyl-N-acetylglucosamine deacetylase, partial [Campylobacter coli]